MTKSIKRSKLIIKLGKQIAQSRRNVKLSQEVFAEKIGTTNTTLSRIERGVTDTNISMLEKIANGLGLEVSCLFSEAETIHLGLSQELEEIIKLLKNQKHSTIKTALKQIEALVDLTK